MQSISPKEMEQFGSFDVSKPNLKTYVINLMFYLYRPETLRFIKEMWSWISQRLKILGSVDITLTTCSLLTGQRITDGKSHKLFHTAQSNLTLPLLLFITVYHAMRDSILSRTRKMAPHNHLDLSYIYQSSFTQVTISTCHYLTPKNSLAASSNWLILIRIGSLTCQTRSHHSSMVD